MVFAVPLTTKAPQSHKPAALGLSSSESLSSEELSAFFAGVCFDGDAVTDLAAGDGPGTAGFTAEADFPGKSSHINQINQSIDQPTDRPTYWLIDQSINQSINQSICWNLNILKTIFFRKEDEAYPVPVSRPELFRLPNHWNHWKIRPSSLAVF